MCNIQSHVAEWGHLHRGGERCWMPVSDVPRCAVKDCEIQNVISVFGYACVCVCLCTFNGTLSNILSLSNGNSVLPQKVRKAVRLSGKAVVSLSWWQCGLTLTQVLKGLWKPERSEMNPICQLEIKHFNYEKWSYELFTQQQPDDIITLHNDRGALTGLWYSLQHTVCVYTHQVHK